MPPLSLPVVDRRSFDNSVLSSLGRCPRLGLFNYRLARATEGENFPINFGVAYHDFREVLETLHAKWVLEEGKALQAVQTLIYQTASSFALREWSDPPLEHKKSYLDAGRALSTFEEAFENWLQEKRNGYYKVIARESPFELPLPRWLCHKCYTWTDPSKAVQLGGAELACPHCEAGLLKIEYFSGIFDQILEWNGRLWIRDFKTVGRRDKWDDKYSPDHQFTGYVWAGQQLSGHAIDGVIVEVVYNIKTQGPEFHPTLANRSKDDIEHWLEWVEMEIANWYRYVNTDTWPMRTTACNDYGGCFFRQPCRSGSWFAIEEWLKERTVFSVWDPLNKEMERGLPE